MITREKTRVGVVSAVDIRGDVFEQQVLWRSCNRGRYVDAGIQQ